MSASRSTEEITYESYMKDIEQIETMFNRFTSVASKFSDCLEEIYSITKSGNDYICLSSMIDIFKTKYFGKNMRMDILPYNDNILKLEKSFDKIEILEELFYEEGGDLFHIIQALLYRFEKKMNLHEQRKFREIVQKIKSERPVFIKENIEEISDSSAVAVAPVEETTHDDSEEISAKSGSG